MKTIRFHIAAFLIIFCQLSGYSQLDYGDAPDIFQANTYPTTILSNGVFVLST